MKKKIIWIILLIGGMVPFTIPLVAGIYDSINGFGGLCFAACEKSYGLCAFIDSIYLYSFIFWPSYLVGLVLIIISVIKLRKK
ncbi:MAG: hypothetical protein E7164_04675 [Firmicutes bacterium]|nr:hypothetical protein [Bacillota bacterium]